MEGFATYYGQTNLHPMAITLVALLAAFALLAPRRYALIPLFLAATTAPMAQRLVLGGADLTLLRLLLLVYVVRLLMRGEYRDMGWNRQDLAIILWVCSGTLIMTLHYGTSDAFINRAGWAYDILITYFLVRCLIQSWDDVLALARAVAVISVPIAALFLLEWSTRYNLFSVFGGVPSMTSIREGRLRCQGPFAHPILAGTFWAATLPLIWMLWREGGRDRLLTLVGTGGALVIVAACASSTPILSALAAGVGLAFFIFRQQRTLVWAGFFACLAILHFFLMNNPVWHLIARVDVLGGSTGWHRYWIFETFLRNFSEWRLTGHSNPVEWGVWQMRDITNQYILEGLRGGLLTLSIFLLVYVFAFANVGRALTLVVGRPAREWVVWLIGVGVFVHVVSFWGVSYFGQMSAILYLQLGLAGAVLRLIPASDSVAERDSQVRAPLAITPGNTKGLLGRYLESPASRLPS